MGQVRFRDSLATIRSRKLTQKRSSYTAIFFLIVNCS